MLVQVFLGLVETLQRNRQTDHAYAIAWLIPQFQAL